MKELLQNHPNDREFPVNSFQIVKGAILERKKMAFLRPIQAIGLSSLWITTILLIAVSTGMTGLTIDSNNVPSAGYILLAMLIGFSLLGIFLSVYTFLRIKNLPGTEQKRYYTQAGLSVLSEEQRQALRLHIVRCYYNGYWVETLEHYPLKSRIPQDNDDEYRFLPLSDAEPHQSQIYQDWGIINKKGYLKMLHALWAGMHSERFAVDSAFSDGEMFNVLGSLIEESPEYVKQCTESINGRPPVLLWGFDLWRAIVLSRNCFAAGYISEETAWKNILKTADYVYEIFGSFDEFYTNYRLGNAYWSSDFDMAKKRLKEFQFYKQYCDWPMAELPWPKVKGIFIEQYMKDGFADVVNSMLLDQMDNSSGDEIMDEMIDEESSHIENRVLH
ncbi:DUF1266 domain-containing protein [Xenorhabdus sp. 42]|uniref:DUF1266 domain-containing protein n=2 Tax=Xenorhabdus szentirmaii TaxID=290112 RepID=A0AAW3Z033_9GAMM|nr:DUF1266 domain-containing protein [Xenorhabdus sp. CUL]MBD2802409.1 DUF1266 domain-containing protein [Xenorhabdus sp. M]MBD2821078.1 DUF1266 domain-containing protein [Xenorhabdus sp. 42]MBD2824213.1 DUF1266 domain-containing protein [Xenorhabdus sp. 5]